MKHLPIKRITIIALLISVAAVSCQTEHKGEPIARVYDKYLYKDDLKNIFLSNVSPEDSILIAKAYIEKWIQTQLLLKQAELNLSDNEKNVARQLEDYRASLLIHKYEQAFINQKIDTIVSDSEVEEYYNLNKDNFVLTEPIVKALYIKLRKEAPQAQKIKEIYRSEKQEDIQLLDNLAYQAAIFYDFFNDKWVPFSLIAKELPYPVKDLKEVLARKYIEMEDGSFIYLVSIRDVTHQGQIAPLEYVINELKQILLNSRKQKIIEDLEKSIYLKAKDNNNFEIFK
jgi:hypothetical protein